MSSSVENPSLRATGFANASLILAISSILAGPFTAVPAVICGHKALSRMRKNAAIHGFGRALAGTILGYCFLMLFLCFILMIVVYLLSEVPAPPPA